MGKPGSPVAPRPARPAAADFGDATPAGSAAQNKTTPRQSDALARAEDTVHEARRKVVLAALNALERCFDEYGPAGFRLWLFNVPLLCLAVLLNWLTDAPLWLSSLPLTVTAGGGFGYAAWSVWTRSRN
jgi:hypothetical protein